MKKTYLFYDLETSGLSKPFDQIQQFAGKRLDAEFNEIESSFLEASISPDVIPSPYAVMTHQIGLDEDSGRMSENQAVQLIHAMMNVPNTISIGYNSLGFDDEFLRFAFYRNLLSPYTHQHANGCVRFDVFPIAVFYYLFENSALSWPILDGKPTLRLEHIVTENDWFQGRAHHAMNDVDATIRLAQHLQKANPEMWQYLSGYFDKTVDQERIFALPMAFADHVDFRYGLMVHSKFGADNLYQAMVLALGNHNHYKNQTVWLRLDRQDLSGLSFEELASSGNIIRKKYAEPGFLLPPSEHFTRHMSLDRMKTVSANLETIRKNYSAFESVQREAREFVYDRVEQVDVDAGLYEFGFLTRDEQQLCQQLHLALPKTKKMLIQDIKNPNLYKQAVIMLWREGAEISAKDEAKFINPRVQKILQSNEPTDIFDFKGQRKRGIYEATAELKSIDEMSSLDADQKKAIESYRVWLEKRRSE